MTKTDFASSSCIEVSWHAMMSVQHCYLLNILMISLLSLLTMVFSFLSHRIGTVYLPEASVPNCGKPVKHMCSDAKQLVSLKCH